MYCFFSLFLFIVFIRINRDFLVSYAYFHSQKSIMLKASIKQDIRRHYQSIAQHRPHFRSRKEQNYLIAEISKTLAGTYQEQRRICVIEAGTGTGKSLAYLLAGLPLAQAQGKTLCISTATVALQEQLIHQELPAFLQHTDLDFKFGIAKGRQRYMCRKKIEALLHPNQSAQWLLPPDTAQVEALEALYEAYQDQTWSGDYDHLPFPVEDGLWQQIASDKHSCQKHIAGHQDCPFHQARDLMQSFDVIVTNHHLLLADLELGGGVILPDPDSMFYVIDEAHHLPLTLRSFSSAHTSLKATGQWLKKLDKPMQNIKKMVGSALIEQPIKQLLEGTKQSHKMLEDVVQILESNQLCQGAEQRFRASKGQLPDALKRLSQDLAKVAVSILDNMHKCQTLLSEQFKDGSIKKADNDTMQLQLGTSLQRLENFHKLWSMMGRDDTPGEAPLVRWFEASHQEQSQDYYASASPIEVGHLLDQYLWSKAAGVILCSATLRALNSFHHFQQQTGLKEGDGTQYIALASPFDYQKNANLLLPKMRHDPSEAEFTEELIEKIPELLKHEQATLVLFSSYKQMQQTVASIRHKVKTPIFVQGEEPRHTLLKKHKKRCKDQKPSIIFGTSSFSEGLDLPGDYLTNLIITKLPFAVPTSPVEEAHAEYIKAQGGQPFMQLTLPDASRKLIQSCGRLLRSEEDYGRVVLLDKRVQTRRYGRDLLDALPPFRRVIE